MIKRSLQEREKYKRGEEASQEEETEKKRSLRGRYKKGEEALPRREEREEREERREPPGLNWGKGFEFVAKAGRGW